MQPKNIEEIMEEFDKDVAQQAGWVFVEDSDSRDDAANQGYDAACKQARIFLARSLQSLLLEAEIQITDKTMGHIDEGVVQVLRNMRGV
jgi:hypothetical protein